MFCKNCGNEVNNGATVCLHCGVLMGVGNNYCSNCGFKPDPLAIICVRCGKPLKGSATNHANNTNHVNVAPQKNNNVHTMGEAINSCFKKYATFSGRATRAEYWFFALFQFLIMLIPLSMMINPLLASINDPYYLSYGSGITIYAIGITFTILIGFAFFLPALAVTVRRLHDTGKSGWLYFIGWIPYIGSIILLILVCQDSQPGDNQYGNNPKELN